jgi:hypothetical protein
MALYEPGDGYGNLRIAIVLQALKDYCHEPGPDDRKSDFDKDIIRGELASEYLYNITDGLSLIALRALNKDEAKIIANLSKLTST